MVEERLDEAVAVGRDDSRVSLHPLGFKEALAAPPALRPPSPDEDGNHHVYR
ncbi:MAG: hypothetical protein M3198_15510 [Actinomycetota bacterium]|nr:hypothetical protein [Actinomycetota bacterium]